MLDFLQKDFNKRNDFVAIKKIIEEESPKSDNSSDDYNMIYKFKLESILIHS